MPEKQRGMILSFQFLNYFPCWFASRLWNILLCGKKSAIIRWPPRNVTALQVVRTSILGPRLLSSSPLVPTLRSAQTKVSRESTPYIYIFYSSIVRVFLTPAIIRAALCRFASGATSLRLLVDNLVMLHTSFSFSFVENHFVVKIDQMMVPLFLVLLSLLAVGHATSKFNRYNQVGVSYDVW